MSVNTMDSIRLSGTVGTSHALNDVGTIGEKTPQSQLKKFDPLDILPEEIWIAIITESATETRPDVGIVISQNALLDLMQVSRDWTVQISSTAMLWVDIILEDEYDAAAKAALALHYSKQAPLALYMYYPTGWWDTLQEPIMANRSRITKLFIHNLHNSSFELPILRQISPLPGIATLRYVMPLHLVPEVRLSYLSGSSIAWTNLWLDRITLSDNTIRVFRELRLCCELEHVFDLLEGSESLQEVFVYPGFAIRDDKPTLDGKNLFLEGQPLPWKSLTYRSDKGLFLVAIIARLPKLVELRINVSQQIFCSLMPLISQLENLYIFDVILLGKWDRLEGLMIPQASTRVQEAVIDISSDISLVMEPVVNALFRCLANIQHLTLQCRNFPTIRMLTASTGFQYLKTLFLDAIRDQEDTWSNSDGVLESFPTSVEWVSYSIYGTVAKQLIPVQSHQIKHLEIYRCSLFEMDMYSQRWTAMGTIGLGYNTTINWKGPAYWYLHTISLKTLFGGAPGRGGRNGTKVCRDIALHPEYFPALRKLEFGACPELDILFILLETRNVALRPGISPISTLVIPTRCPPYLVERLRELVKGIGRGASHYYDLSIAGNYDIITDASITGCCECHRALRFCATNLRLPGAHLPTIVMEYPDSVTEILESWDVRAEKWYPVEGTLRYKQCDRKFPPVSITRWAEYEDGFGS